SIIILTLIGLRSATTAPTQMTDTRAIVKAMYLYTFATLVEWPENKRTGDFVIGVYGERTGVYDELIKKYLNKAIGSQKIVIKNYKTKEETKACHILYVTEEKTNDLPSL